MFTNAAREVSLKILDQIQIGTKMRIGYHDAWLDPSRRGVVFQAKIHPFTKAGRRSTAARIMRVDIQLNGKDLYDIQVGFFRKFPDWETHFKVTDVPVEKLNTLLLALDYDGPEVLNPALA